MIYAAILFVIILLTGSLHWPRRVHLRRIVDGDSIEVKRGSRILRVRIAHLDAPEYRQPGGRASLRHLEQLLVRRKLRLCSGTIDKYGRTVATLLVDGHPVHWAMIRAGHAWPATTFGHALSWGPRLRRRGLWGDPQRMHPSRWRKLYAHRHPGLILD